MVLSVAGWPNVELDKNPISQVEKKTDAESKSLSKKYKILGLYKAILLLGVAFMLISLLFQLSSIPSGNEGLAIMTIITSIIGIFSSLCLIKMIDFLYDLDKSKLGKWTYYQAPHSWGFLFVGWWVDFKY